MIKRQKATIALFAISIAWAGLAAPLHADAEETAPDQAPERMIQEPQWLKKPSSADLMFSYPAPNAKNRGGGSALLTCLVTVQGALERCKVTQEKPEGSGFGGSALLLAPTFRMRPMIVDGVPVTGAQVRIPVVFGALDAMPGASITVLTAPPWLKTPTPEEVAAAYPAGAGALERGHIALRCKLLPDGHLKECKAVDSAAKNQFGAAANKLTPMFQVAMDLMEAQLPKNVYVNLALDLPNPQKPQPPARLLEPNWMALPQPEDVKAAFPERARAQKVATGSAVLDCVADHAGYLTNCAVASETPAALGFGQAALTLSHKMRVSPWTTSGTPSDGVLVRMPLRINDEGAPAPPPKP